MINVYYQTIILQKKMFYDNKMEGGMIMFHHNQRDPRRRHRRGDQGGVPCFWQGGPRIHTSARPDRGALSLSLSWLLKPQLNTGSTKARWKTLPFRVPGLKMKVLRASKRERECLKSAQVGPHVHCVCLALFPKAIFVSFSKMWY